MLEKYPEADKFAISQAFDYVQKKAFRISVLDKQKRMDGRGYQDLRPITCEVGVLPRAHGSAIFQRGETQALALVTLAPIEEAQNIDAYGGGETRRASFCITTSRRSASAKPAAPAARAVARSATARWPSVRSNRSFPAQRISVMRSASRARSWNQTAPARWRAFAAECSR